MPAHPWATNFTAGELTEQLLARTDWAKYANGAACLKNFLVRPHGGAARRAGTMYIAAVKDPSSRVFLHPFQFNVTQAYMLEFGNLYIRFYANRGRIEIANVPVEVVTPYLTDELRSLRFEQSADVLYIAHQLHQPMKLQRTAVDAFQLDPINFNPPPTFEQDVLPAADLSMTSAAIGTGVTFVASAAVWLAGDVGRQIKSGVGRAVITTFTNTTTVVGAILDAFDSTGPIPSGQWSMDGSPNAGTNTIAASGPLNAPSSFITSLDAYRSTDVGKYIHAAGGIAKIYQIDNATTAHALIVKAFTGTPPIVVPAGAWTLESDAWSDALGWPGVVALHDQRLWFAGSAEFPDTVWGSVVGDYENFGVGPADDDAVSFPLAAAGVNLIRWLKGLSDGLGVGTIAGELSLGAGTDTAITPSAVNAKPQTPYGSDYAVDAIRIANVILFLQRGSRRLREYAFDFVNSNSYVATDLAIIAEHLTRDGILEMAYASSPDSILFCIRPDGILLTLTYERPEQVVGWAHHETQGEFESVAVIPNNCGSGDEAWVAVRRGVSGGAWWHANWWNSAWWHDDWWALAGEVERRGLEVFDGSMNTDAGLVYSGPAASTFSGLGHLEGLTVKAISAGDTVYDLVVAGGSITLPDSATATELEVGLHFASTLQTLRPELATNIGTAQARPKHWNHVSLRVVCTHGTVLLNGEPVQYPEEVAATVASLTPYTGDMLRKMNLGWDREGQLTIQTTEPKPCTILGITGAIQLDDG